GVVLGLSACGAPTDEGNDVGSVTAALHGNGNGNGHGHGHGNGNGHGHGHGNGNGNGNGHGHGHGNGNGHGHGHKSGEELFETAFPGTNGRSCATCHVREDHTVLKPAHVIALEAENPLDPLF